MSPKAEIFFDAITLLPEDMVEEAQDYRFRKSGSGWKKVGSLAACVVLILSVSLLAVVPRGCGASGGNSSAAPPVSTDTAAPAEEPRESVSGGSAPGMIPDNGGGDANGSAEDGYGQVGNVRFRAAVLEVNDDSILVEPLEGEELRNSYDRIVVHTKHLELPPLAVGDEIRIAYDGWIVENDPPVITGAAAVELPEE